MAGLAELNFDGHVLSLLPEQYARLEALWVVLI